MGSGSKRIVKVRQGGAGRENVDAVTMMVEECLCAIEVHVGIYARLRLRMSCVPA